MDQQKGSRTHKYLVKRHKLFRESTRRHEDCLVAQEFWAFVKEAMVDSDICVYVNVGEYIYIYM